MVRLTSRAPQLVSSMPVSFRCDDVEDTASNHESSLQMVVLELLPYFFLLVGLTSYTTLLALSFECGDAPCYSDVEWSGILPT